MLKLHALLLSSLAVLTVTPVSAESRTSSLTRADVIAEYQRARLAGEVRHPEYDASHGHGQVASSARSLTRAEVQAELKRARDAGELRHIDHHHDVAAVAFPSTLTRAQVFQEYERARVSGELAEARNDFGSPQYRRVIR